MKVKIIILICFAIGFISSCKDEPASEETLFESTGSIMGSDKGMCPCCGGWILQIDGDESAYRIEQLPDGSGIELNEDIISVKFNWNVDRECGGFIYINIEEIELN